MNDVLRPRKQDVVLSPEHWLKVFADPEKEGVQFAMAVMRRRPIQDKIV